MSNSKGQNPCLVVSWLLTPCNSPADVRRGADSVVGPLGPEEHYVGPIATSTSATPCKCNTVYYSMIQACAACQGLSTFSQPWPTWSMNCTDPYAEAVIGQYSLNIPPGTSIPSWAYLDITWRPVTHSARSSVQTSGTFNATAALALAEQDKPDSSASSAIMLPTSSASNSAPNSASTTSPDSGPSGAPNGAGDGGTNGQQKTNVGAIVGGVVGGLAVLALAAAAVAAWVVRRRRTNADRVPSAMFSPGPGSASVPFMAELPPSPMAAKPFRPYNPDDPTTFPGYQSHPDSIGSGAMVGSPTSYRPSVATSARGAYMPQF
ncbi:uncharacterized protein BXZ73DRAFT_76219 [Epithele typhae]|uniref:uncharacterized protein n=1 Tax=Epithele typhae TaxID=378194 RepID=UPI0020076D32|nr:uncharacterized protein BXZ73DRAFT_76219 [Epithele typhae]KAH9939081.1 hypothetical protein BXZ73DRAFT_76219 [Epithele typhae]